MTHPFGSHEVRALRCLVDLPGHKKDACTLHVGGVLCRPHTSWGGLRNTRKIQQRRDQRESVESARLSHSTMCTHVAVQQYGRHAGRGVRTNLVRAAGQRPHPWPSVRARARSRPSDAACAAPSAACMRPGPRPCRTARLLSPCAATWLGPWLGPWLAASPHRPCHRAAQRPCTSSCSRKCSRMPGRTSSTSAIFSRKGSSLSSSVSFGSSNHDSMGIPL